MIIRKLTLHNFGVYAGTNTFRFNGEKPIVLIGGMNGRGKTTFLDAVLLALYGANSFAYKESSYKSYGQYLKSYVNQGDGTSRAFIMLEFQVGAGNEEIYQIQRSWDGDKKRTSEQLLVWKNGEEDEFLTGNWALFIENLMPSGLSNFFFFDGEKIAELAVEETNEQMKESIKMLLGISTIDALQSDLGRVASRAEKQQSGSSVDSGIIEQQRKNRDATSQNLAKAEAEIAALQDQKASILQQIEAKKEEYSAKGGDIYAQRQQLYTKRSGLMTRIEALEEQLVVDSASELPLQLVHRLLSAIRIRAELEHEQKMLGGTLMKLEMLFKAYTNVSDPDRQAVSQFIDYVRSTVKPETENRFEGLSDASLSKLQVLLDSRLAENKGEITKRKEELANLRKQVDQLDNYLSVEIDEDAINRLFREIKELEQTLIAIDVKLHGAEEECRTLRGKAIASASEFKKLLDEYIRRVELNDDSDRIIKYVHMASTILDEYTKKLQQKKVTLVAKTMTECYKQLANKTSLIDRIEMDSVTLDLRYISPEGTEVNRASLSAGEKQLMVISLLWALAQCSKKKLPVIIDTPLSRLDSAHRNTVIQTYFPQASEQTIILSTDTEIDQGSYGLMKPNVGDEFTLVYDNETKSTSIQTGYFPGVAQ